MPSVGKFLFASLGVAVATSKAPKIVVPVPRWVLGDKGKNCKDTCKKAGTGLEDCDARAWPESRAAFESILENIIGDKKLAQCSAFVDAPAAPLYQFKGPVISKGVCWYSTTEKQIDCQHTPASDDERRVCRCYSKDVVYLRDPIPDPIKYPAVYKQAQKATIIFTIKFLFFHSDAFECLGGGLWTASVSQGVKHNEPLATIANGIKQMYGSELMEIEFVAPKMYSDPLEAKISVYATPEEAESVLLQAKVRDIGFKLVENHPELKMCAHLANQENYTTEYGTAPMFTAAVTPHSPWIPARKEDISLDSAVFALGVDIRSLGVASAGVLLVAGVVVLWRHRQEREMVYSTCE